MISRKALVLLSIALAIAAVAPRPVAAQALPTDGPLTARAADAVYLAEALANNSALVDHIKAANDGAKILAFLNDPLPKSGQTLWVPSADDLSALRKWEAAREKAASVEKSLAYLMTINHADLSANVVALATVSSTTPATGLPSPSTLLTGLSDFVVSRAQQEVAATMLAAISHKFDTNAMLYTLFPNTRTALHVVPEQDLSSVILLIRAAALKDYASFPDSILSPTVLKLLKVPADNDTIQLRVDLLRGSVSIAASVSRRVSPLVALSAFADVSDAKVPSAPARTAFRLSGEISREVVAGSDKRLLTLVRSDPGGRFTAMFLLSDVEGPATVVQAADADHIKRFFDGIAQVSTLVQLASQIQTAVDNADAKDTKAVVLQRDVALLRLAAQVIVAADASVALATGRSDGDGAALAVTVADAAELGGDIASKDYHAAILATVTLLNSLKVTLPAGVVRWATFSATLAAASSAADVSAALEQYALPSNSYVAKRLVPKGESYHFEMTLNAYLGGFGGSERITNETGGGSSTFVGAMLPVGPEFAFAWSSGFSFSLFLPIIDLGAIASYRLGDQNAATAPNVGVAQVFAPGAFITFTLWPRLPIDFGAGYQFAPQLRSVSQISTTGTVTTNVNANRIGVFVGVDVPLFRLR